ncbi:hypothetical protein D9615_010379 [Tricholomella constricta]|uniref:Uncharacterized protein n=1 Tax=Tricholomella constricta TaxID=117010 RepID=A0A8H5GNK6_9AGAR|nr:hypothetical protein D9615_010379 [Tricholomella constricta]
MINNVCPTFDLPSTLHPTMARAASPPPAYAYGGTERTPILSGISGAGTFRAQREYEYDSLKSSDDGDRKLTTILICIIAILLLIPAGLLGAYIDRSMTVDTADPRVRNRILRQWEKKIKNYEHRAHELSEEQRRMNNEYRRQETEWQQTIKEYEEELKGRREREKREREEAQLFWVDIHGEQHCLKNGHRKYTARLANLPWLMNGVEACRATQVTINGITYDSPIACEDRGMFDGVYGHWIAGNEGACAAYWEFTKDKGCTAQGSGLRRIEAKLGVVHAGENAELLCLTTPLTIYGRTYDRPMFCPYWGKYGFWGIWNIPDDNCRW